MAEFVGFADTISDLIYEFLMISYKIFRYIFLKVNDGLGHVIAIAFEYFVKLFEQISRFMFR